MPAMPEIKDRLRNLRKTHKYTQKDVANFLGISESAYGYYEQGRNEPSIEAVKKLAEKYNVSSSYILCETENPSEGIIEIAGNPVKLTASELEVFNKIKKQPLLFHKLANAPEKKIKALIRMWEALETAEEDEDEDIIED
jgi:transcriptional regulator with XRE-family HTH domain